MGFFSSGKKEIASDEESDEEKLDVEPINAATQGLSSGFMHNRKVYYDRSVSNGFDELKAMKFGLAVTYFKRAKNWSAHEEKFGEKGEYLLTYADGSFIIKKAK